MWTQVSRVLQMAVHSDLGSPHFSQNMLALVYFDGPRKLENSSDGRCQKLRVSVS